MRTLRSALTLFLCLAALTGLAYPLLVTGAARLLLPRPSAGSLIRQGGLLVGSELIQIPREDPAHFWGRLSATAGGPCNGLASGASNRSAGNPELRAAAEARLEALARAEGGALPGPVPVELVTASGSGLDPHLSPGAAEYQVPRVARARGMDPERLRAMVRARTRGRFLGLLGEPVVNLTLLNLDLDREAASDKLAR